VVKFVGDFMFGLAFGCGFLVAYGLLKLIVILLSHAGVPPVLN
jgi:hypothetical protein